VTFYGFFLLDVFFFSLLHMYYYEVIQYQFNLNIVLVKLFTWECMRLSV